MIETDIIDRSFLQQLRDAAKGMAHGNLNPDWVRAYIALSDAADRLDAMYARRTVVVSYAGCDQGVPPVIDPPTQTC